MICPACIRRDPPKEVSMTPTYLALYDLGNPNGAPMAQSVQCPLCGHIINIAEVQ